MDPTADGGRGSPVGGGRAQEEEYGPVVVVAAGAAVAATTGGDAGRGTAASWGPSRLVMLGWREGGRSDGPLFVSGWWRGGSSGVSMKGEYQNAGI